MVQRLGFLAAVIMFRELVLAGQHPIMIFSRVSLTQIGQPPKGKLRDF
jgi:hypothetical protein